MSRHIKGNKGFSLVELIIVIAIMAILVGVVGTQVIPYIEKSRQSKDLQILGGLCTNMTAAAANCAGSIDANTDYIITIAVTNGNLGASTITNGPGKDELLNNFIELCGGNVSTTYIGQSFESKDARSNGTNVKCTLTQSNPIGSDGNGVVVELQGATKISKASSK